MNNQVFSPNDEADIAKYVPSSTSGALRQGEIISDLRQYIPSTDRANPDNSVNTSLRIHPYAIIVSQDCDLDWDYNARYQQKDDPKAEHRLLPSVLFCEVYLAQELRDRSDVNRGLWKRIRQNSEERYHFFEGVDSTLDAESSGIDELSVDFKRYFAIPAQDVYIQLEMHLAERRCRLTSPYLEHLSTRFAYYQFRVALPGQHVSLKGGI